MKAIALDLGSTYTKCAILDAETKEIRTLERLETPPNNAAAPMRYEIDVEAYYHQVMGTLIRARQQHPDVDSVLFSTQMHGFVLTDDCMRPITPFVSWRDQASLEDGAMEELRAKGAEDFMKDAGVPLKPNLALCSLYARVRTGLTIPHGAKLYSLGGYMIARMTGEAICHTTNAGPWGLLNARTGEWNIPLLHAMLGDGLVLPELVAEVAPVGIWSGMAVYPDIGDHQACVLGSGLMPEEGIHINLGTAGLVGRLSHAFQTGEYETRPFFGGLYLLTRSGLPGGRHLDVLASFVESVLNAMGIGRSREAIWEVLTSIEGRGTMEVGMDIFHGNGCVRGIGADASLTDLTASIYRSMAEAYACAAKALGGRIAHVKFSGGLAERNPALRRAILRGLGKIPGDAVHPDDVMRGLLILYGRFRAK